MRRKTKKGREKRQRKGEKEDERKEKKTAFGRERRQRKGEK